MAERPVLPPIHLDPSRLDLTPEDLCAQVARWCGILFAQDQVVELRALDVPSGRDWTVPWNGYFAADAIPTLAQAALGLPRATKGVYFTLNPLNPALLARRRNRIARCGKGDAATDADVLVRRWLLIDVDPRRPANIGATSTEKEHAGRLALAVREDLHERGWPEPIVGDSGNGFVLLYRVDLPVEDGGLVRRMLARLAERFDTESAQIDQSVHNPARLCKLPGTWARKGDSTEDRPHRQSRLLHVPGELASVPRELLESLAEQAPAPVAATATMPAESAGPAPACVRRPGSGTWNRRLDVPRWLRDRGVGFRTKEGVDANGRTVHVLAACPFNADHRDPDACVMQDAEGKLSARCLHNSCSGRGWQEFKNTIGAPERRHYDVPGLMSAQASPTSRRRCPSPGPTHSPPTESSMAGSCPTGTGPDGEPDAPDDPPFETDRPDHNNSPAIVINSRQLPDVTCDALSALAATNDPPVLFQFGGVLSRVRAGDDLDPWRIEPLTDSSLKGIMARAATWVAVRSAPGGGVEYVDASPPMEVVKDLATLPRWDRVPTIRAVVETPVFARDGTLVRTPGYHAAARVWYAPADGFEVPAVPERPTDGEIAAARDLIHSDLLGDFPFADDASRAHAVAMLLLAFVRALVDGPTPFHLVDAPTEGTGKTLLIKVLLGIVFGRDTPPIPEAENDGEWRKRLTAALVEGRPVLFLDNLNRTLDSGSLASALTTETWSDRLLGVSKMVQVPNRAVWIGSGNNTTLSRELVRRTLWCRLDAGVERPSERTVFRHPKLLAWTRANRGRLVAAALTLVQAWMSRGRPPGTQTMGMYESWAETIGGILEVAGIPWLLTNREAFQSSHQAGTDDWPAFLIAWWAAHRDRPVGVAELYQIAVAQLLLDGVLLDGGERSQRTRLGTALTKQVNRVNGPFRIENADPDHSGRRRYWLRRLETAVPPPTGAAASDPEDDPDLDTPLETDPDHEAVRQKVAESIGR